MFWLGLVGLLLFLAFVIQTLIQQNELLRDRERIQRLISIDR